MRQVACAVLLALVPSATSSAETPAGVVVESVGAGGAAESVGIQVGDRLLGWRRDSGAEPAEGVFSSPFDVIDALAEQAPRGPVKVWLEREGSRLEVELAHRDWLVEVRPVLDQSALAALEAARQAETEVGRLRAVSDLESAAEQCSGSTRAWLLVEAAQLSAASERQEQLFEAAADAASGEHLTRAWVREGQGDARMARSDREGAAAAHRAALAERQAGAPGSLLVAQSWYDVGRAAWLQGDLEVAERAWREAFVIRDRLAPDSLEVATTVNTLGAVALRRGKLAEGEQLLRQALATKLRLAPGSLGLALTYNNLGLVARRRGDLELAEAWYRKALDLIERLSPDSLDVAMACLNLGTVAHDRGDLEAAEMWYRRDLAITERLAPNTLDAAATYTNLGVAAHDRGDLESAEAWYRKDLAISERLAPDSLEVAATATNLGSVALDRGDLTAAREWFEKALGIKQREAPGSLSLAATCHNLGLVAGDRGELEAAEGWHRRALAIRERLAPQSSAEAESLGSLARIVRSAGRPDEARALLERGVASVEAQQGRLGGSPDDLATFREKHLGLYRDLVDLLLELDRGDQAVRVLEAARARALLALLAERDVIHQDVPAELETEWRRVNAEWERATAALGQAADEDERLTALGELGAVRRLQDEVRSRIRAAAPRLAELRYPEPLNLAGVQQLLEPGTVFLAWMVGEEHSALITVTSTTCQGTRLELGEEDLRRRVRQLRQAIQSPDADQGVLAGSAAGLANALLAPAAERIAGAHRLLMLPDGPLWFLPFAALPDPTAEGSLMVEARPYSVAHSATVLARLGQGKRPGEARLVAFGDAVYPAEAVGLRRGPTTLAALPATRLEVQAIGALHGEAATLLLGTDATEERAKALGRDAVPPAIVHFAAHGIIDERFPLESAVALTIPAAWDPTAPEPGDNGLLQVWEIFEGVRIDADLVVLSACDTALGQEVAGEGLIGLSRAFQHAGARSVLASLWTVADLSTAELMVRFYANLRAGDSKVVALQKAQQELIRGPIRVTRGDEVTEHDFSHPYHWAAFQLIGDWR